MGDWRDLGRSQSPAKRNRENNNDHQLGGGRWGLNRFTPTTVANSHLLLPIGSVQHSRILVDKEDRADKKQKTSLVYYSHNNNNNNNNTCQYYPSTPPPATTPSTSGSSVISSDHSNLTPSSSNKPPTSPISPVIYSQDSIKSSESSSLAKADLKPNKKLHCAEDAGFGERVDLKEVSMRLFTNSTTKGEFNYLKTHLKPILLQRLSDLSKKEVAVCKVGQEMADSILSLKLLRSTDPELEIVGDKSWRGAMLLQEGEKLVKEAQEMFCSALANNKYA